MNVVDSKSRKKSTQSQYSSPLLPRDGWQIGIDPETGGVEVGPWPDRSGWSDRYPFVIGHCCGFPMYAEQDIPIALYLGADRRALARELMKIDGYVIGSA